MKMDNNSAMKLLEEGAVFILVDAPVGMEFGIDMKIWTTGEKFKGVKMIPPGPHYIYYSVKSKYGDSAPRSGFIHVFKRGEFFIRRWDIENECINTDYPEETEVIRFKTNIRELDQYLGPYPYDIWAKWKALSKHINDNVVKKLTPECGYIRSAPDLIRVEKTEESISKKRWSKCRTEEERQEDVLPELVPTPGSQIRFTSMPSRRYPEGSSPSEITFHYLDSSYALNSMLSNCQNPLEFLGEIQFSFVCFLLGLNLESFEQWKKLVQLLCNCMKALKRFTQMYSEFITCLEIHLEEVPEDFLVDIVANNNIIYRSLRDFFANIELSRNDIDGRLCCKCDNFKKKLTSKFGWNFSNLMLEEGDDAPLVVEL